MKNLEAKLKEISPEKWGEFIKANWENTIVFITDIIYIQDELRSISGYQEGIAKINEVLIPRLSIKDNLFKPLYDNMSGSEVGLIVSYLQENGYNHADYLNQDDIQYMAFQKVITPKIPNVIKRISSGSNIDDHLKELAGVNWEKKVVDIIYPLLFSDGYRERFDSLLSLAPNANKHNRIAGILIEEICSRTLELSLADAILERALGACNDDDSSSILYIATDIALDACHKYMDYLLSQGMEQKMLDVIERLDKFLKSVKPNVLNEVIYDIDLSPSIKAFLILSGRSNQLIRFCFEHINEFHANTIRFMDLVIRKEYDEFSSLTQEKLLEIASVLSYEFANTPLMKREHFDGFFKLINDCDRKKEVEKFII